MTSSNRHFESSSDIIKFLRSQYEEKAALYQEVKKREAESFAIYCSDNPPNPSENGYKMFSKIGEEIQRSMQKINTNIKKCQEALEDHEKLPSSIRSSL